MAHCFIMDFDGATAAQYDAVIDDMELNGRLPAHHGQARSRSAEDHVVPGP